jgi:hypothetical protein
MFSFFGGKEREPKETAPALLGKLGLQSPDFVRDKRSKRLRAELATIMRYFIKTALFDILSSLL